MDVLIAEPHEVIRYGLHTIFEQDPRVLHVYEVTNKEDLHTRMTACQFDLIVVNQSLAIDRLTFMARRFIVLASSPNMVALKRSYYAGALGYLTIDVTSDLLRTFLNSSQKPFLIEPTLGPWIVEAVFHVSHYLSNSQIDLHRKSIRPAFLGRNKENYRSVATDLMMLMLYLSQ